MGHTIKHGGKQEVAPSNSMVIAYSMQAVSEVCSVPCNFHQGSVGSRHVKESH